MGREASTAPLPPPVTARYLHIDEEEVEKVQREWRAARAVPKPPPPPARLAPFPISLGAAILVCPHCRVAPVSWQCRECDDVFCNNQCWGVRHKSPRRGGHPPPVKVEGGDERAAHPPPPVMLPPFPQHVWVRGVPHSLCVRCHGEVGVVVDPEGQPICLQCLVKRFCVRWGRLRIILRGCEVCERFEARPAMFSCVMCDMDLCPHCWAAEHHHDEQLEHRPNFLYPAATGYLLHLSPTFRPYLRFARSCGPKTRAEPLPDTAPDFTSTFSLSRLVPIPPCMNPDQWTRRYPFPVTVVIASGPFQAPRDEEKEPQAESDTSVASTTSSLGVYPTSFTPPLKFGIR